MEFMNNGDLKNNNSLVQNDHKMQKKICCNNHEVFKRK